MVACHLADSRNGQYIRVICQLLLVPFLGQQPFLALIVQLALQRCGWFLVLGVVVIPPAGRSVVHRVGLSAVEILGNIFLGDFIAARFLSVVFAGNKPALQEIKRGSCSDMAYDAEIVAAHRVRIEELFKDVAIGTGVILVCVTVSCLTAGTGVPTAVNLIFTAAAKTGTSFALSSAALSGISAGVVRGYQTGDMEEALETAALAGSENFKWGAIAGAVVGGGSKALSIYRSSRGQPTFRQSEQKVAELTDGGVEQVAYLDHQEVPMSTGGSTRPDVVVRNPDGTVLAKEVKNYNLESSSSLGELIQELRRQISDRLRHLPSGSTQEIVLDVRGRGVFDRLPQQNRQLYQIEAG